MTPGTNIDTQGNLTFDRGGAVILQMSYQDNQGTVLDLTGYSAALMIRELPSVNSPVIANWSGYIELSNGADDYNITIVVPGSETELVEISRGGWDILLTDDEGIELYLIRGTVCVQGVYTR